MDNASKVVRRLKRMIADDGPISVADFMIVALSDPDIGYYATRDPFGEDGDFTTAPEISQMFGELLGLWCVDTWRSIGSPDPVALVELGPGRGTLMADALRAIDTVPACRKAVRIHLVEKSPVLRAAQEETLRGESVVWHRGIPMLDGEPAIFLANEFLDAQPIQQFVYVRGTWRERMIFCDRDTGALRFGPAGLDWEGDPGAEYLEGAAEGAILEEGPSASAVVRRISRHICVHRGAGLMIDYGYTRHAIGETLQAVRRHRPVDPLAAPGESDLTAHVNFQALAEAARAARARVWGPVEQAGFLTRLGIRERAETLRRNADDAQARDIDSALERLTAPGEMGALFKAFAMTDERVERLAGFEAAP